MTEAVNTQLNEVDKVIRREGGFWVVLGSYRSGVYGAPAYLCEASIRERRGASSRQV